MKIRHVRIEGQVQGVYYRVWTQETAKNLGLEGWVKNRSDGSVEALFYGADDKVEEMINACLAGPQAAQVDEITIIASEGAAPGGFSILKTV